MGKTALIIVDCQNDFLPPDGSLAVPDGRAVIPIIQGLLDPAKWGWDMVIASQDYHPPGHISFASTHDVQPFTTKSVCDAHGNEYEQAMWPDHCVIGTRGAEIDSDLRHSFEPWKSKMRIARKACYKNLEAYSSFEGMLTDPTNPKDEPPSGDGSDVPKVNHVKDGEMSRYLYDQQVTNVVVTGLATDYCVVETVLSSISSGFRTLVVGPAVRGIKEQQVKDALIRMEQAGATFVGKDENDTDWEAELHRWLKA